MDKAVSALYEESRLRSQPLTAEQVEAGPGSKQYFRYRNEPHLEEHVLFHCDPFRLYLNHADELILLCPGSGYFPAINNLGDRWVGGLPDLVFRYGSVIHVWEFKRMLAFSHIPQALKYHDACVKTFAGYDVQTLIITDRVTIGLQEWLHIAPRLWNEFPTFNVVIAGDTVKE